MTCLASCVTSALQQATVSRLRQTCLLTACFVALCIMLSVARLAHNNCSYSGTVRVVQDLCSNYANGQVSGPMCSAMCEKDHFTLDFCGQDASSDKSVLIMGCSNCRLGQDVSKVVMKTTYNSARVMNITRSLFRTHEDISQIISRTEAFVKRKIAENLGIALPRHFEALSQLLGSSFNIWIQHTKQKRDIVTMLRTLVSLSLQPEYIKLSFLGPSLYLPKLYGFCGPAFFVENTPSLAQLGYVVPFKAMPSELASWNFKLASWTQRAEAALDLLSTLRSLETRNGPTLHICDMEVRNTGTSGSENVVFLDIDKTRYGMEFSGWNCSHDYHCHVETCEGRCDTENGVCAPERVNGNIQVACKKLLVGHYGGVFGLLRFPPTSIEEELTRLLDQCANPSKYSVARSRTSGVEMLEKLGTLLHRSLEET